VGYQTVHHDVWDDDIPASPIIYDAPYRPYRILKSGTWVDNPALGFHGSKAVGVKVKYTGKAVMRPAIAEASKMGFVFILNRKTGRPLIPTPEMKVDQTNGQGLNLWPTQPIPLGDYFTSQCVLPTQWNAPGPDGKPVQHGCTYTPVNIDHFVAIPHDEGEWMPSSYDPKTHNLYICTIDNRAWAMEALPAAKQATTLKPGASYLGILLTQGVRAGYTGGFTAMNLLTNKIAWRDNWADFCYSGATATAGGVVFAGHNDGRIEAMDSSNGHSLWNSDTSDAAANAPVITYTVGGKQYVSVFAGGDAHENTTRGDIVNTYALP
jgi:alcohol dehydrogenase (cytochrome c)/quinohemoprotein ethanol dehydrogenase